MIVLISTREACDFGERISRSCALGFLPKHELSAAALAGLLAFRDASNSISGGVAGE